MRAIYRPLPSLQKPFLCFGCGPIGEKSRFTLRQPFLFKNGGNNELRKMGTDYNFEKFVFFYSPVFLDMAEKV